MEDGRKQTRVYLIVIIQDMHLLPNSLITILEELSPFRRRSVVVHVLCMQPRLVDTIAESCFHLASLQVDD